MDNNKSRSRVSAALFSEKIISLILQKDKKKNKSNPDQTKGQKVTKFLKCIDSVLYFYWLKCRHTSHK